MGNGEPIIVKPMKRWTPKCDNPKCYICNPTKEMKDKDLDKIYETDNG